MKTAFCLVLGLLVVLHSPPSSLAQSSASTPPADVTLTIEKWVAMSPTLPFTTWDIVMNTVTPDWFCKELKTFGKLVLDVETNNDVTLRCPQAGTLENGTSYTLEVEIALMPVNYAYPCGAYWCLDFAAGSYIGATSLQVSLKKHWWVEDIAGIYRDTVLLEIIPNP